MRRPTISPATLSPATARANASCAARRPTRSSACRRISPRKTWVSRSTTATARPALCAPWRPGHMTATTARATKRFYPELQKRNLFRLGYIAAQSKHSTGTTVDLTLIRRPAAAAAAFDPAARYGPCTGPAAKRAPDNSIDMGTGFDCFDLRSHGANKEISPEQKRWRATLNGDAPPRLCELLPRMVALFIHRRRRTARPMISRSGREADERVDGLSLSWPGLSRPPRLGGHSASLSEITGTSPG